MQVEFLRICKQLLIRFSKTLKSLSSHILLLVIKFDINNLKYCLRLFCCGFEHKPSNAFEDATEPVGCKNKDMRNNLRKLIALSLTSEKSRVLKMTKLIVSSATRLERYVAKLRAYFGFIFCNSVNFSRITDRNSRCMALLHLQMLIVKR